MLDVIKLVKYRPDFYGGPMQVTHEAMRGPSAWSVGDRELMAAVVRRRTSASGAPGRSAVAGGAYSDDGKVSAALADLDTAPIGEPLRATLRMLRKLDARARSGRGRHARRAGGRRVAPADRGCARGRSPSTRSRLADAFGFSCRVPPKLSRLGAKYLLARGYR